MIYRSVGKRALDLVAGLGLLILSSPVIAVLALLVRVCHGSPVLFRQPRAGRDGRPFMLYKFRSMTEERDARGELKPDAERLTPFGAWLRSTSLDELPTLVNVVKGEMSLVGPRPLLVDYLPLYTRRQTRRHDVLPGITGLAQVDGRNAIGWGQKFARDCVYVREHDLCMDLWILWRTLRVVARRGGIAADRHATMPRFDGRVRP